MEFIKRNKVLLAFLLFDVLFVALHFITNGRRMFDLDNEYNFPAYYQAMKLFSIALLSVLFITATKLSFKKNWLLKMFWLALTVGALYLSIDEMLLLHENISTYFGTLFGSSNVEAYENVFVRRGFQSVDWLLFYIPVLVGLIVGTLLIAKNLFKEYRNDIFIVFLTLAAFCVTFVIEYIGKSGGLSLSRIQALVVLEELTEMVGITLLLWFVVRRFRILDIKLKNTD